MVSQNCPCIKSCSVHARLIRGTISSVKLTIRLLGFVSHRHTVASTPLVCLHECYTPTVVVPQVLHRLQNKEKPIRTTFTLRFGSLKMIFECSIARCDVGLGRAIVQCQKNPLRKPKLSINRAILSAHFSAVKFCIGFFCWIGFFWFCIGFFCNWMLQLLLKIVAKNLNYASLHVCT